MEQWSVLSPLLFAVVSNEGRRGLPSEVLYADYLVIMAPIMEHQGRRVAEWRVILFYKGLKVNESKVMVGSCGGKMIEKAM